MDANTTAAPAPLRRADEALREMQRASTARQWEIFFETVSPEARQARVDAIAREVRPAPALPECAEFQGTGTRCTSCRIRRALHA